MATRIDLLTYTMSSGDVARVLGVTDERVRQLDAELKPRRQENGQRRYDPAIVKRVAEQRAAGRASSNAKTLRRLREQAVAAGLCQQCRCRPQKPGCKTCEHCLEQRRERVSAYRAVGLCKCGRQPRAGLTFCDVCLERHSAWERRYRREHKANGVCTMCAHPAEPGRTMCARHLESTVKRVAEVQRAYSDAGLCKCGKEPRPGIKSCTGCIERAQAYYARRVERRKQRGLCIRCTQPAVPGLLSCERHRASRRARRAA